MSVWKLRSTLGQLQPLSFISTYLNGKREQREREGKLRSEWGTRPLPASSANKRVAKKNGQIPENGLSQCTPSTTHTSTYTEREIARGECRPPPLSLQEP